MESTTAPGGAMEAMVVVTELGVLLLPSAMGEPCKTWFGSSSSPQTFTRGPKVMTWSEDVS